MNIEKLFEGQELSEEFKTSVTTMYQASVNEAVADAVAAKEVELVEAHQTEVAQLQEKAEDYGQYIKEYAEDYGQYIKEHFETQIAESSKKYEDLVEEYMQEQVIDKVDSFLNYVAEQWMEDNKLAVEKGLRSEMVEGFLGGLHKLFSEHYVDVPESKVDVVEEMSERIDALQDKLDSTLSENIQMKQTLREGVKSEVVRSMGRDLTESQQERLNKLAEGVEFKDEESFRHKMGVFVKTMTESNVAAEPVISETRTTGAVQSLTEQFEKMPEMQNLLDGLNRLAPRK